MPLERRSDNIAEAVVDRPTSPQPHEHQDSPEVFTSGEIPLTVRAAALYLGVSPQTVYLWVERKQIPHFRVMGRNIRFLKSELQPFRAQFKQEVEIGKAN
ncbi:MAG: helix-turn-helix domain-containing protein [Bryobacteraceae bacterium]